MRPLLISLAVILLLGGAAFAQNSTAAAPKEYTLTITVENMDSNAGTLEERTALELTAGDRLDPPGRACGC